MYPIAYFQNQKFIFKFVFLPCTKYLLACLKIFCNLTYEIKNLHYVNASHPVIIGCNHQSAWETFIFSLLSDGLTIVIKKELLKIPIAGMYFKKLDCIPIDRSNAVGAIKTIIKYGQLAKRRNQNILIFPNGTRSNNSDFKIGIYALYKSLQLPVVPAHVNSGEFWPRHSFKKKAGNIVLEFKPPIDIGLNKEEFMQQLNNQLNEK